MMFSSNLTTVVGLLVATLSVGTAARGVEPINLLTNGGFEEGMAGWDPDPQHSLLTDEPAAHSGKACLTGKVTEANQALRLRRRVSVKAGNRYEFVIWARATNRTKLVLFAVQPKKDERQRIASWQGVPTKWRRYAAPLTIQQDGTLQLEIIAPSSHGSPAGQIWIDDVALHETPMPPLTPVSKGVGFNDEPAMAQAGDGSVYVAWNSFRDGTDSLQLVRFQPEGKTFKTVGTWQVLGGKGTYVLHTCAVSAGQKVFVVFAAEKDKNWDIYAVACGADGPGKPVAVTSNSCVDVKPAAAWRDGILWVAWESNRNGSRQILAASVRGGDVSEPIPVSRPGASCYNPSIAVLAGGDVCVAWHGFHKNNYDVYLRRKASGGSWQAETRLTRAPSIDRHPVLFARSGQLWIAYESAHTERYNIGRTNRRQLIVAKITPQGLLAPKNGSSHFPLADRCE